MQIITVIITVLTHNTSPNRQETLNLHVAEVQM